MTCKDCYHYEVCDCKNYNVADCDRFKDKNKIIELPCNVGDTVFTIYEDVILDYEIDIIYMSNDEIIFEHGVSFSCTDKDIGKTVFLSKAEAENKLKKGEDMKSVLISIQPKWCELIASGAKTVEVRKTRPKIETPFKCYIYCTQKTSKGFGLCNDDGRVGLIHTLNYDYASKNNMPILNGMVIGEFVCNYISKFEYKKGGFLVKGDVSTTIDELAKSRLTDTEFREYAKEKSVYGWHISDLKIYDKPKELAEFKKRDTTYDNSFGGYFEDRKKYTPIKRPPQSWCYVKELERKE